MNKYPGGFPNGFIARVRRKWWGRKRLWLFSGGFRDPGGTMVDVKPEVKPTVVADCSDLPLKSASFDFVLLDPPYSKEEALALYGTEYPSMVAVLNEAARVVAPGGVLLFLHRLVPSTHPRFTHFRGFKLEAVVGVFTLAGLTNMRALSVWRKPGTLASAFA